MTALRVVVIGAGMGGLAAALDLARQGCEVTILEKAADVGGKARRLLVAGRPVDAGPTVLTMRWVFEDMFADAGASLSAAVALAPASIIARHAWGIRERLDLHADIEDSVAAIAAFAGPKEAAGYRSFVDRARTMFETLDRPFIRRQRPRLDQLVAHYGPFGLGKLRRISPFSTLWSALADHFADPRLRQLFGRYATYCGSSPFLAPATLMLVAHVEREGVWLVEGGIQALARAIAERAVGFGATLRLDASVARIVVEQGAACGVTLATGEYLEADAVVVNADPSALTAGLFGAAVKTVAPPVTPRQRSLSAVTFASLAHTEGFPLAHHNVFFSRDYGVEFDDILRKERLPDDPTVYVCAQDQNGGLPAPIGGERLLCLVNAPATGDAAPLSDEEIARCETRMRTTLARCGLQLQAVETVTTQPCDWNRLFPETGGALYGPASHGWQASFARAGARSKVKGLYLAGGSVHPGPGVPMAAISGRLAAAALLDDRSSIGRSARTAITGGTSMP